MLGVVTGGGVVAAGGVIGGGGVRLGTSRGADGRAVADVSGAIVAVAAGRGVIGRGGPRLISRGERGRMVSLVSGATVGVGKVVRGGAVLRGIVGGVALGTGAVTTGVGLILTGIDAEGRVVGVAEIAEVGVAAAAVTVGDGRVLGEA